MAEVIKISVPQEVITIEVNDKGDTIVLPVSDERFNKKLLTFVDTVQTEANKLKNIEDEDIVTQVDKDITFHEMLKTEFDNLFGEKAYEKVYGDDILVGAEYIIEFIDQCMPYIQKFSQKRIDKLTKYSANRVGSSL